MKVDNIEYLYPINFNFLAVSFLLVDLFHYDLFIYLRINKDIIYININIFLRVSFSNLTW